MSAAAISTMTRRMGEAGADADDLEDFKLLHADANEHQRRAFDARSRATKIYRAWCPAPTSLDCLAAARSKGGPSSVTALAKRMGCGWTHAQGLIDELIARGQLRAVEGRYVVVSK